MSAPRVLLAEPSAPVAATLRRFLETAGYEVRAVGFVDEAVERMQAEPVDLVITSAAGHFDGETLCRRLKQLQPACPVVLVYPPELDDPEVHAAGAGADAYLVGPLKRGTVLSCAQTMLRMSSLAETVERLEGDLRKHIAEPPQDVEHIEGTSADFEFFKKFLLMEVKRSRRYRYPVSFLLVSLDHFGERTAALEPSARTSVLAEALGAITRGIRDIDLAIPSGENRFLVFLPHTPKDGAVFVAARLQERLGKLMALSDSTASIGVSSFEPAKAQGQVSFGTMMKEAGEALAKAQLAGGNRIESGEPTEKAKRDRISLA